VKVETDAVERILSLFRDSGDGAYFGEAVTETEHALQCAHWAERAGSPPEVIAAALLHDVGHLLHDLGEDFADRGIDDRHEDGGAKWLAEYFDPAVTDPVRLHVAAKRYLCAVDPTYQSGLSKASLLSLRLQGGPMSEEEVADFERKPHYRSAVAVRRWDDAAKVPGLAVPGLEHYRSLLASVATNREAE
jgi:[1-hydroxy-2-(trimethylamino)ethyl]phosphonate dioxygenase